MTSLPLTKKSYQLAFKMQIKVTIYNNRSISSIYKTNFNQTFFKMMLRRPETKMSYQMKLKMQVKDINYRNYYIAAIIRPIVTKLFTKMIQLRLATKVSYQLISKMQVVTFHRNNISAIIRPNSTKFVSRKMTPLPRLLRLCIQPVQALINLPQITASFTWIHPANQPFICGYTALVIFENRQRNPVIYRLHAPGSLVVDIKSRSVKQFETEQFHMFL